MWMEDITSNKVQGAKEKYLHHLMFKYVFPYYKSGFINYVIIVYKI